MFKSPAAGRTPRPDIIVRLPEDVLWYWMYCGTQRCSDSCKRTCTVVRVSDEGVQDCPCTLHLSVSFQISNSEALHGKTLKSLPAFFGGVTHSMLLACARGLQNRHGTGAPSVVMTCHMCPHKCRRRNPLMSWCRTGQHSEPPAKHQQGSSPDTGQ